MYVDTVKCVELAINNPPPAGHRVEIFNQVAETLIVGDLAKMISEQTGVPVSFLTNPRQEDAANELEVIHEKFSNLGLQAVTLEKSLMDEVVSVARKYKHRAILEKVQPSSYWNRARAQAATEYAEVSEAPPNTTCTSGCGDEL